VPEGIDVSKWQTSVDWSAVAAAGKTFAVCRSSIGSSTIDETFRNYYQGSLNAGLVPGAYHLVSGKSTGPAQAANLKAQLDAVGFQKGLLVLDVEGWEDTTGFEAGTLAATEYLCDWIRTIYNRDPIIYTGVFWRESLKQHPNNFGSELWLAYYGTGPNNFVPTAWDGWRLWQYTETGKVAGITGNVDLNKSAGTLRSLKSLAGWGWDELATQAEIRTIVSDEVNKAVTSLTSVNNTNRDTVLSAANTNRDALLNTLREVEVRLAADIASNRHADTMTRDELTTKFNEILGAVVADGTDTDYTPTLAQLSTMIDTLHKHVCQRVDLHA